MGKVEDLRRLREERRAEIMKSESKSVARRLGVQLGAQRPAEPSQGRRRVALESVGSQPVAATVTPPCGHRSVGGKSCTRPVGHTEKNHRYKA